MTIKCEKCGSYAINSHLHGRDGTRPDLCDVCFWRERSSQLVTTLLGTVQVLEHIATKHATGCAPDSVDWDWVRERVEQARDAIKKNGGEG